MKRALLHATVAAAALLCSACSFLNQDSRIVTVTLEPADSKMIINGIEYAAFSPQFVSVNSVRELLITVYKPGYKERFYAVGSQLSSTGKIDAWGSFLLFPAIGLFSDGAWELKERNIFIKLEKLKPADQENQKPQK